MGEADARENFVCPSATVTLAGSSMLWCDDIEGYKFKVIHSSSTVANSSTNSYSEIVDLHDQIKSTLLVEQSKNFQNRYPQISTDEESDLKKKEKLYILVLNRSHSYKYPKIKRLPNIGNLQTIFETFSYSLTSNALTSPTEKQDLTELTENTNEVQTSFCTIPSNKNKEKFRKVKIVFKKVSCIP